MRQNPRNAKALNYLGYTYAERGVKLKEAESMIKQALELEPDNNAFMDSLGWVYYQMGNLELAVKHLERAAELSPPDGLICEHLADAYMRAKQPAKALALYQKALALYRSAEEKTKDNEAGLRRVQDKIATLNQSLNKP